MTRRDLVEAQLQSAESWETAVVEAQVRQVVVLHVQFFQPGEVDELRHQQMVLRHVEHR